MQNRALQDRTPPARGSAQGTTRSRSVRGPVHGLGGVLAGVCLALAGCASEPSDAGSSTPGRPTGSAAPSAKASGSVAPEPATPSWLPTAAATLSAAQQEAFQEATLAALAYRQTIVDLYSGLRTRVEDLDNVAIGDVLDGTSQKVEQGLRSGATVEPYGVQLRIASATPVDIDLNSNPAIVVAEICVDATALTDVKADGTRVQGGRQRFNYYMSQSDNVGSSGWVVSRTTGHPEVEDRLC